MCFEDGHDRRVLPCLHSFCAACIDRLALTEGTADRQICCPLCRRRVCLSESGACGLPKDITQLAGQEVKCETCKEQGKDGEPAVWCVKCRVAVCKEHIGDHVLSGQGPTWHSLGNLPSPGSTPTDCEAMCAVHNSPLKYFCTLCDEAVCGDCMAIGSHHGHQPVVTMKEYEDQRRQRVEENVNKLESVVLPEVEATICAADEVSTELLQCADAVRAEVEAEGERVIDTIRACIKQRLQDVDDIKQVRHKALDKQREELESHAKALKTAVQFGKKLTAQGGGETGLLTLLDQRAKELEMAQFDRSPVEKSLLAYKTTSDTDMTLRSNGILGAVKACQASAAKSCVQGRLSKFTIVGKCADFVLLPKDKDGKVLASGGDVVHAIWTKAPVDVEKLHPATVKCTDGGYTVSCQTPHPGTYSGRLRHVQLSWTGDLGFGTSTRRSAAKFTEPAHLDERRCLKLSRFR